MESFYYWVTKHKLLFFILSSVFLCSVYSFLFVFLKMPFWAIIVINLILLFINYCFATSCQNKLVNKAISDLDNHCNPYPLLQITELLLSCKNSKLIEQSLQMNYCAALESVGEYQKAFDILSSINIDKYAGTLPIAKVVYYNNLMNACIHLGKFDLADLLHSKVMLMYQDIKNMKQKKQLEPTVLYSEAYACFRKQEYEKTIHILNNLRTDSLRMKVSIAMLYANASLLLNDTKTAKEKLKYVINIGNKLFCVTEAQKLLENCSK